MKLKQLKITTFLMVLLCAILINAQDFIVQGDNTFWDSDTIYIGVDLVAREISKNVVVYLEKEKLKNRLFAKGDLYFMMPGIQDSALFLFHNDVIQYPDQPDSINIGNFEEDTPLVFMMIVTDENSIYEPFKDKKLYSGKNESGESEYISEVSNAYGLKCAAVGSHNDTIELGFEVTSTGAFIDMIVRIRGAKLVD